MSAQTAPVVVAPPYENLPCCPEAQADGVPCEDSSSQCGACGHLAAPVTRTVPGQKSELAAGKAENPKAR